MPVNSSSIPALVTAAKVRRRRRKKRASGGGIFDWSGVSEALPEDIGKERIPDPIYHVAKGALWDLPHRAIDAAKGTSYGLRREDFTDVPPDYSPDPNSPLGSIGVAVPKGAWQPTDELIGASLEGAMNTMGGTALSAPAKGVGEVVAGAGPARRAAGEALEAAPKAVTPTRWTGTGYHGTASDFEEFVPKAPFNKLTGKSDVEGIYFSGDPMQASQYARMAARREGAGKQRVIAADLAMENPLDITKSIKNGQRRGLSFGDAKRAALEKLTPEHDGVIFHGNSVNPPEYIAFNNGQITRKPVTLGAEATDRKAAALAAVDDLLAQEQRLAPVMSGRDPIQAYHGSDVAGLGELRPSERGPLGPGVYMSPNSSVASRYGGNMYEAQFSPDDLFHGTPQADSNINRYEVWRDQTRRLVDAAEPEMKAPVAALMEKMWPEDGYPMYVRLAQLYKGDAGAQALMQRAGYKGMTANVDGPEIVHYGTVNLKGAANEPANISAAERLEDGLSDLPSEGRRLHKDRGGAAVESASEMDGIANWESAGVDLSDIQRGGRGRDGEGAAPKIQEGSGARGVVSSEGRVGEDVGDLSRAGAAESHGETPRSVAARRGMAGGSIGGASSGSRDHSGSKAARLFEKNNVARGQSAGGHKERLSAKSNHVVSKSRRSLMSAALEVARKIKRKKGGRVHIGPIVGDTGGRADKVPMKVPDGAYVIPADIVSGLGEGNTGAGMVQLSKMFPKSKPSIMRDSPGAVPILAADGEFVISPDSIKDRWEDLDYGHRALDAWVLHERENLIKTLEGLDGPAQD